PVHPVKNLNLGLIQMCCGQEAQWTTDKSCTTLSPLLPCSPAPLLLCFLALLLTYRPEFAIVCIPFKKSRSDA
ncbi:MAG: hypothetical protein L0229_30525, partial [Blastocatellia bacterium]|nr:hypothetical protein [Blastocatellia bacterium]